MTGKSKKPVSYEDWFKVMNWEASLIIFAFLGCQEAIIDAVKGFGVGGILLKLFVFILFISFMASLFNYMERKYPTENFAMLLVSESRRTVRLSMYPIFIKLISTSFMFMTASMSYFILLVHHLI